MFIIRDTNKNKHQIQLKKIELNNTQLKLNNLEKSYKKLNTDSKATEQERLKLEQEKKDLQTQLEAKRLLKEQEKVYAAEAPVYAVSTDAAKAFIYQHESGNDPTSVNSIGCRGLGQACPGSKLPCGDDYACQDAYFTQYAMQRYGSWEAAYQFWILHNWW